MGLLWVPETERRYTQNDLLADAASLGCKHAKPRTIRTYVERGLLNHPVRDWPGYGGGSSGGWWPQPQFALWHAEITQCMKVGQQHMREILVFPGLFNIPVAGWLYFGEASGVPLSQVRRAIKSWILYSHTPSLEVANRSAASLVRTTAHPQATDRRIRRKELAKWIQTGERPDQEELLYTFQQLLDPKGKGLVRGSPEAPLAPDSLRDLILARYEIQKRLRDKSEQILDGLWEWARFVLLWTQGWYQETQPHLASDPAVQAYPELQALYRPETFETIVNDACAHLVTTLGLASLAEHATHLHPVFLPGSWLAGRIRLVVEFKPEVSPIILPNGERNAFAHVTVQVKWE